MHTSIAVYTQHCPSEDDLAFLMYPYATYDGIDLPGMEITPCLVDDRDAFLELYRTPNLYFLEHGEMIRVPRYFNLKDRDGFTENNRAVSYIKSGDENVNSFLETVNTKDYINIDDLFLVHPEFYKQHGKSIIIKTAGAIYGSELAFAKYYYNDLSPADNGTAVDYKNSDYRNGYISVNPDMSVSGIYEWENPQGMWDWWQTGGRFKEKLIYKNDGKFKNGHQAQVKDIDFKLMELCKHRDTLVGHISDIKEIALKNDCLVQSVYDFWDVEIGPYIHDHKNDGVSSKARRMANEYGFSYNFCYSTLKEHERRAKGYSTLCWGFLKDGELTTRDTTELYRDTDDATWEAIVKDWFTGLDSEGWITIIDAHY